MFIYVLLIFLLFFPSCATMQGEEITYEKEEREGFSFLLDEYHSVLIEKEGEIYTLSSPTLFSFLPLNHATGEDGSIYLWNTRFQINIRKKGEWANVNYQNKLKVVRVIDINKSYLDLRDLA